MTKVNLLPDYIWEGKRRTLTLVGVLAALLVEILAVLFWVMTTKDQIRDAETARQDAEQRANAVDQITQKAQAIEASIKPIVDKTTYVEEVIAHNGKFPALFERTNMYTYNGVGYRQLQPAQTVLNMTAYTRTVADIGRYLLNIQRAKDTFTTVSITSQMPGWPFAGSNTDTTTVATTTPTGPGGPGGPFGPGGGAFGPGGAQPGTPGVQLTALGTAPAPQMIDFTAVGQLTQKFAIVPPVYAANPNGADPSAGGGGPSGYPGGYGAPGGFGPAGGPNPGTTEMSAGANGPAKGG